MFSLQSMFGRKDRVLELLQASSEAAREAARAVSELTREDADNAPCTATFTAARRRGKELAVQIGEELANTFVTVLDREDIEAVNAGLYRIPKTVAKFAARYALVSWRLRGVDFSRRTAILATCTEVVAEMVHELRNGLRIGPMRKLQDRLQLLEGQADQLLLEPYSRLHVDDSDPIRAVLAKDLFETIERAVDACRDTGNVIYGIVLKHS